MKLTPLVSPGMLPVTNIVERALIAELAKAASAATATEMSSNVDGDESLEVMLLTKAALSAPTDKFKVIV